MHKLTLKDRQKAGRIAQDKCRFLRSCKPTHTRRFDEFTAEWFDACKKAFIAAMREHYPERECRQ